MPLIACPACARHVHARDSRCPFCSVALGAIAAAVALGVGCNPAPEPPLAQPYGVPPTPTAEQPAPIRDASEVSTDAGAASTKTDTDK